MSGQALASWYQEYAEALNDHAYERLESYIADEVVVGGGSRVPRSAVISALQQIADVVPDIRWDMQELIVDRDGLAVRAINRGTPVKQWLGVDPTGKSFEIVEYAIYRVKDGRFVQMINLHDSAELVRQLNS